MTLPRDVGGTFIGSADVPGGCLCRTCVAERKLPAAWTLVTGFSSFRFACEICGNKRCPHHTDHRLVCTNSNETGQTGSDFQ